MRQPLLKLLSALALVALPQLAVAGSNDNAKVASHLRVHSAKGSACVASPTPPCNPASSLTVVGSLATGYDLYLLVLDGSPSAGVSGVEVRVAYTSAEGPLVGGLDVFSWTPCGDLQFPSTSWPDAGSTNKITWEIPDNCQDSPASGDYDNGVTAVAGSFYVYAYGDDTFDIIGANVSDCGGTITTLPRSNLGVSGFGAAAGVDPCASTDTVSVWGFTSGEDGSWSKEFGPQEPNGEVLAIYEHDGALLIGGRFTRIGDATMRYLAQWDGQAWSPLDGLNGPVHDIVEFQDDLIVCGSFAFAGTTAVNGVAAWDGSDWEALDGGLNDDGTPPTARSLEVFKGELYVGGDNFTGAGSATSKKIARWTGTAWEPLDGGLGDGTLFTGVYDMVNVNDASLIVAGHFEIVGGDSIRNVAQWSGTEWSAMDAQGQDKGPTAPVYAVNVFGGVPYIGGAFTQVEVAEGLFTNASFFARWSGATWLAPSPIQVDSEVYALEVISGAVENDGFSTDYMMLGGSFGRFGLTASPHVARWDGVAYSSPAGGFRQLVEESEMLQYSMTRL